MNQHLKKGVLALVACALVLAVPGSANAAEKRSGTKTCAAGKQVYIYSWAGGRIKHKFKSTRGGKVRIHDFYKYQGYLMADRRTPTGMRSVKWVVTAYDRPYTGKIEKAKAYCAK